MPSDSSFDRAGSAQTAAANVLDGRSLPQKPGTGTQPTAAFRLPNVGWDGTCVGRVREAAEQPQVA